MYVCEREGGRKSVFFLERQGKVRNLQATLSEKKGERQRGGVSVCKRKKYYFLVKVCNIR